LNGQWSAPAYLETPAAHAAGSQQGKERHRNKRMAAKNTLKYNRSRLPPLVDIINTLIDKCLDSIQSPEFKAKFPDLITLIRKRLELKPIERKPPKIVWVD
jgi:hypothetical protein